MGLPSPTFLSLSEAIEYVVQRCGCSRREAKKALSRAGQDGFLKASGNIPLSAHPNPEVRDAHPVRKREALQAADWGDQIDWATGMVRRYYSVTIERASIEAWLAQTEDVSPTSLSLTEQNLKTASDSTIDETITTVYDEAEKAGKKPPNLKEIGPAVNKKLCADGYHPSDRRIQEIAGNEKHAKRRRKPGKTVLSERSGD